jgi:hypothetical protein
VTVRRRLVTLAAVWAFSVCGLPACSGGTSTQDDGSGDGAVEASSDDGTTVKGRDGGRRDAGHSGPHPDATCDAARDAAHDATLDATDDASLDAPRDVSRDVPRDTSTDTALDVSHDASRDATLDAVHDGPSDAAREVSRDASPDATLDAPRDAPREALPDAPVDALHDATRDAPRDAPVDALHDAARDAPRDAPVDTPCDAPRDAGPPSLVALTVSEPSSGDAAAPNALIPQFFPTIHDYYVRCAAGTNQLTVSMTASPGSTSLVVQPTVSSSAPQQTLTVSVNDGQALVAEAADGTAVTDYWVRCLPSDFPHLQWKLHPRAGTPVPGYYLLGTAQPTTGCYAMVLDSNGVPVWYVSSTPTSLGWCVYDVDDVVSGAVSFYASSDIPEDFEIHQLSPLVTTDLAANGQNVARHELLLLSNGDYLVVSTPFETLDLTGMQLPLSDGGVETLSGPQTVTACNLLELAPDGTAVWTWTGSDHLDAVKESVVPILTAGTSNFVVDPFHCNSVDVDLASGNLLVSARQMNSVFYVDRSTGRVLWKMGGTTYNKDGATHVSVADPFVLQHDARFESAWSLNGNGGSGKVSVFDDESEGARTARAVVYDVVVGSGDGGVGDAGGGCDAAPPDGGSGGTATVTWQYAGPTSSVSMGSFRILGDGTRVIGWGSILGLAMTELDSKGKDVLDFSFTDCNTSYRAIKVPLSAYDLDVLRSTAGVQ